ncbi:DUF2076 domain-containing protein [Pseudomonas sichuanensis]|uniref:DUF2076 domain-containing protein n=1 Tax=Pseudomonas sichuanensis TaxID=2213015 RepID=UPI0024468674|nr:DUF2076 domain-containing protein [Pseudomonas sichuanensis]MDH1584375.1 DUF2076 domain-containing protein [Pseudomonas sichuanensis]MDH1594306.1 DUF2076 domain-containing protein [Pseudomonas sichuanensis]MDH1598341.1 DUF2076 domain-containing protein [Pseudomonas sichuanensis]
MNTEEQTLIDGLFGRLKQAEDPAQPRDAQAQACIEQHLRQQPAAPYYMAQAILVQEAAIKRLDEQNKQLEAELKQARAQAEASRSSAGNGGGGFLSSIFGGGARSPEPQRSVAPPPPSAGGWREPAPQAYAPPQPQQGFGAAPAPARSGTSSFLGGAMQTAAGVAGGVLLAQGISSLFNHHSQPEEVVEVIKEEPAPASDTGGWNDQGGQQQVADNGGWGSDQGGFADTDYGSDDGGFFSDDDYV